MKRLGYGRGGWWRGRRRSLYRRMTPRQYAAMMRKLSQIAGWQRARFNIESMRLREQSKANFERALRRRW